jgi:hypothetical protein
LNRFQSGAEKFNYIETSDDFIQKIEMRLQSELNIKNIEMTPFIQASFANYLNNLDKNNWSLLTGVNSRWNKLYLNASYGFYPKTYLRKYIDTDGTNQNEKFDYNKMLGRITASYRYNNYIIPLLYGKYEYFHHNQYFTEYDGPAVTTGLGWRFITDYANIDLMYYYRTYSPEPTTTKDPSYESNIYEIKLRTKRYYSTITDFRFYTNFTYENRYFQSQIPLVIDSYHTTRNDDISTLNVGSDLWLTKNLNFNLDFMYRFRRVSSEYDPVIRAKEYDRYQISSTIEWYFDVFRKE